MTMKLLHPSHTQKRKIRSFELSTTTSSAKNNNNNNNNNNNSMNNKYSYFRSFLIFVLSVVVLGSCSIILLVEAGTAPTTSTSSSTTTTTTTGSSISSSQTCSASDSTCSSSSTILSNKKKRDEPPYVEPTVWLPKEIEIELAKDTMIWKDVSVCCDDNTNQNNDEDDAEEDVNKKQDPFTKVIIGRMPQFTTEQSLQVLQNVVSIGWNNGYGLWSQYSLQERIERIEIFVKHLLKVRSRIIHTLQWEIGKNLIDATNEFDRTIQFIEQCITILRKDPDHVFNSISQWETYGSTTIIKRRGPVGIVLCLAPYNYPINESYAMMIPALLMGNVVILKIPTIGGLAHLLAMEAFEQSNVFPPYTINFLSGSGRETMPPLMETGLIDSLAFIGSKNAANQLIHTHPNPHRLKLFLQLEAKNMGIFLPNLFETTTNNDNDNDTKQDGQGTSAALDHALNEAVTGTLSFNGQRCTAIKLLFVPLRYVVDTFLPKFIQKVQELPVGLPWQLHEKQNIVDSTTTTTTTLLPSKITPLPTMDRIIHMQMLLKDALEKGANIMNEHGGEIIGGENSTLMIPAVLYPVTSDMKLYTEEQFGPLIPIVPYDDIDTVITYGQQSIYGQQVSIFTDTTTTHDKDDDNIVNQLIDLFSTIYGKININSQCGRSPDTVPFSARRSSAMGVMSVQDALLEFSIPTVVTYNNNNNQHNQNQNQNSMVVQKEELLTRMKEKSLYLQPLSSTTSTSTSTSKD